MVVAFTSGANSLPEGLVEHFILPAVKANSPLPPNEGANKTLQSLIAEAAAAKPLPVAPFPPIARRISGRIFEMESAVYGYNSFSLTFTKNNECFLRLNDKLEVPVGLDHVYRIMDLKGNSGIDTDPIAARGHWVDQEEFQLEWQSLLPADKLEITLTFSPEMVKMVLENSVTRQVDFGKGKVRP